MTAPDMERKIAALGGLRRAIYHAGISRGLTPDKAYAAASARCCTPAGDPFGHTTGCDASWGDS